MSIEINMNKTRVKKKYKRYWKHGARAGTGQDTAHREMEISEEKMADNWCHTFGHRPGCGHETS